MQSWRTSLVLPSTHLVNAVKVIDENSGKTLMVVNEDERLLGTVTDGDVRRGLLNGVTLKDCVSEVMNRAPKIGKMHEPREILLKRMQEVDARQLPIVDEVGRIVAVEEVENLIDHERPNNTRVLLMAGGVGTRLYPLTENTPKPMLKVGDKPLLETILKKFIKHGFRRFYISVNYKAETVISYFGDGSFWGCEINYLQEHKRMGTAGALSLIEDKPTAPILVMNGDLLTSLDFDHLLAYHFENDAVATVCVREHDFEVPFGVVNMHNHYITSIEEKPVNRCFVNAGIYVLNPECIDHVPNDVFFDMTSLLNRVLGSNSKISAFPIREYWIDIGHPDDLRRANVDFGENFS